VPNASISEWRVEYVNDEPVFYVDRIGDVAHLEHAEAALDEVDK